MMNPQIDAICAELEDDHERVAATELAMRITTLMKDYAPVINMKYGVRAKLARWHAVTRAAIAIYIAADQQQAEKTNKMDREHQPPL